MVEMVVVVAIVAAFTAACVALSQGARLLGTRSATQQFDAALAYATAFARASGTGATLLFEQRTGAGGARVPGFVLRAGTLAPMSSAADVAETKLGSPPFSIVLDAAGHAIGCPAGEGAMTLTFTDSRASDTRTIACSAAVAGAPDAIGTVPP